ACAGASKVDSMVFSYYSNLSRKQKSIYRASDKIKRISLRNASLITPLVARLEEALRNENRSNIETITRQLTQTIIKDLKIPPVRVIVLAVRPSHDWGELHGLYEPAEKKQQACISVWMRTAHHKKIVAFRTFLRTLLHEICHHLDYELFNLEDSLHTEGFFKRESSLFKQLVNG
ncbi:MAG: hypothetical protein HW411_1733, partial [Gammaproteobacteria bacterium]|nr:hypothetical protein [Gammaproteobacteria bacterium]